MIKYTTSHFNLVELLNESLTLFQKAGFACVRKSGSTTGQWKLFVVGDANLTPSLCL